MRQFQREFSVATRGQGLYEVTREAEALVAEARLHTGLAHIFCKHTSCSLLIQENADPDVRRDLTAYFKRLAPDGDPLFTHTIEGPDDMPAHVKAALTQTTLTIPISGGKLALGTWQGVYVFEHRLAPHVRSLILHAMGE